MPDTYSKKLIEVSIPLQEINEASAREKSIRHGHPSTLHLWWARRPLAAARAVLFCQLVDDPSGYVDELLADRVKRQRAQAEVDMELEMTPQASPDLEEKLIERERERLHDIVRELVIWENMTNETVLNKARKEIRESWKRTCRREGKPEDTPMPPVLDPFAGGGAIPLEAQRLGMEAHASDLNPVAVLINKAMIEIPPKFAGQPPVNPDWQAKTKEEKAATTWKGAQGLAEDVHYYGEWMRKEAEKRIGHLYPKYEITQEILDDREDLVKAGYQVGDELTVIAWLWARTVPSPNPALNGKHVPLVSSFWLSKKKGKEAYVEPILNDGGYQFRVRVGMPQNKASADSGTKNGRGAFRCILTGTPFTTSYVQQQGVEGNMSETLLAIVCEGKKSGRVYFPAANNHISVTAQAIPEWRPSGEIPRTLTGGTCVPYGLDNFGKIFTERQLHALNTFTALVGEARDNVLSTKRKYPPFSNLESLENGGEGLLAYADSLALYLGLLIGQLANHSSSICGWNSPNQQLRNTFARQAIPMTWDYAETNVFSKSSGSFSNIHERSVKGFQALGFGMAGVVDQQNASTRKLPESTIISSDPPYYDNIAYADLSDFFYVWLRKCLREFLPIATKEILVPKIEELIASKHRHGGGKKAEAFFLKGMSAVAQSWAEGSNTSFPTTIYYAFKQTEIKSEGLVSTGWATFLDALLQAGFSVIGTWPVRTEKPGRTVSIGTSALASSIVLVCRRRADSAPIATRREFIQLLSAELPDALAALLNSNIAPVDLPQSSIGPGMAIYSRFSKVIEADGNPMSVTTALQLINKGVAEVLSGQESEMDPWTRFAVTWFSQYGFDSGPFGEALSIATARDVSVEGVAEAGILESGGGKVRIYPPSELPEDWDPQSDNRLTIWEIVHHLIRLIDTHGEAGASTILARVSGGLASDARRLCYQLFNLCEQKKWADLARSYNTLITSWPEIAKLAEDQTEIVMEQTELI